MENGERVQRFHEQVWNERRLDVIADHVAAEYVGRSPDGELHGPQGFRAYAELTLRQYPDLRFTGKVVAEDGATVVTHWNIVGTYAGHDPNLPDTVIGREMRLEGVSIERVAEGKIVESR